MKPSFTLPLTILLKQIAKIKLRKSPTVRLDLKSLHITQKPYNLKLNPHDRGLSAQLLALRFREPINTYALCQFIRNNDFDVIIDAGSNIGYFPLVEHASGAKKITAIEPVPETFEFLVENTKQYKNIIAYDVAVGTKSGTAKIYIANYRNLATLLTGAIAANRQQHRRMRLESTITVKVEPLSKFVRGFDSVLLRMDVEGYEQEITKALPKQVTALSFELHPYILGVNAAYNVIRTLWKQKFEIEMLVVGASKLAFATKIFGLERTLRISEVVGETHIFYKPPKRLIKEKIYQGRTPHVFAIR